MIAAFKRRIAVLRARFAACPVRWELAAAACYFVISLDIYLNSSGGRAPTSDGFYSWMYARSLAYDGDLSFENDYKLCGDPLQIGWKTATGRLANIFYLGPAAFWTPFVWILKHLVRHAEGVTAGACSGPVPRFVLVLSTVAGALLVFVVSSMLRRFVGPRLAAFATLLATLGGHMLYFTALNPSYSHVYDALCVGLFLYFVLRLRECPERGRYAWAAGAFFGLAILQRSINMVFFGVAVPWLVWPSAEIAVKPVFQRLQRLAIIGGGGLVFGVAPLALANKYIFGRYTLYTHGPYFIHLTHAHPFLLLFNARGGLFEFAPLLWLVVPGVALLLWDRTVRWAVVPLCVVAVIEIFVSSAAQDWEGARRLLNLTPLFALAIARAVGPAVHWVSGSLERMRAAGAAGVVLLLAWLNGSVCFAFSQGKLPWDTELPMSEIYGESQKQTIRSFELRIGPLPVAPAAWVFALRYGLEPIAFINALNPTWYARNFHTLDFSRRDFDFTASEARPIIRGFTNSDSAACLWGRKASAVFAAQWPFATRAILTLDSDRRAKLHVRRRGFWGAATQWQVSSEVANGNDQRLSMTIPTGGFDSGFNELEFERESSDGTLCFHKIEFYDDTAYAPPP